MKIEHSTRDGVAIIAPAGRIDTTTSGTVEEVIRRAVDEGTRELVVDLTDIEYISSAGLRVFLVLAKRMRDLGGRLVLCGMAEPVRQVFRLAGFLPLFQVELSQDAAVARLAAQP
jgi:anti-anti-sigma factor